MTIKELKSMLKGQYTNILPFNNNHRKAIPFTQLGKEFIGKSGKEFDKVLDTKEVVEYELSNWENVMCWTRKEMASHKGHWEKQRTLIIYFK